MSEWHPCLKQLVRCDILWYNEENKRVKVSATNACRVGDSEVCHRVTAGSLSGEGYELCGPPKHAEQEAVQLLPQGVDMRLAGAVAHIYGHDWLCMDCQHALTAAGVTMFVLTGEAA
jgi:hypothetical protein